MHYKTKTEYQNPLCIENVIEDMPGGGIVDSSEIKSDELLAGSVVGRDDTGLFHLIKTAVLHSAAPPTLKKLHVSKNHEFKVGDVITSKDVKNCKAYDITEVNTDDENYDVVTISTTLGVPLKNGDVLVEVSAEDADGGTSELKYKPEGLTTGTTSIKDGNGDIAIMIRGTVKESLLPYPVPDFVKQKLTDRIYFR